MKRIFAFSLAILSGIFVLNAQDITRYRISNDVICRSFEWDGTTLVDEGITDLESLASFGSGRKFKASDVAMEHIVVPADTLRESFDKFVLSFREGNILVRKEYRLYKGVKAIACDNYFALADSSANCTFPGNWVMERVELPSMHYRLRTVEFWDATDNHDNLVRETESFPFYKNNYRGNLLFASPSNVSSFGVGIWMLKEAPTSRSQLNYQGRDFSSDSENLHMVGVGLLPSDIPYGAWVKGYGSVVGLYDGSNLDVSMSLRAYQKKLRRHIPKRDEMVMMNTWGDRNQDARVGEQFCIEEVEKANRLGISHFQIDDGWQSGKSPNSAFAGGSFKNIWANPDYWTPDPKKYPNGLTPVVEVADRLGVTLGLWYNPSIRDNFSDWRKDADAIIGLWRKYGIKVYKIDGVELPTKEAEVNFRKILDTVIETTGGDVVFNLDVTAGRRGGYFMFNEYGNLFLENRYTDWGNYYPYRSLRNLWMLSRYVPAENIQLEFLNKWRNNGKYSVEDRLSPINYRFEYLFALTMAGQPLAWMEASNLPESGFDIAPLVNEYRSVAADFHEGTVLPIGDEPNGYSWTGFQSIKGNEGYLLIYRELSKSKEGKIKTFLPAGHVVDLEHVLGDVSKKKTTVRVAADGTIPIVLFNTNSFEMLRYRIR